MRNNNNGSRRKTRRSNAKHLAAGLLVAFLLVGASMPAEATLKEDAADAANDLTAAAPKENGCSKTQDGDWWESDNNASCEMTCDADLYLSISVDSSDDEGRYPASVSGDIDCGGGFADCHGDDGHCSGGGSTDSGAKTSSYGTGTCKGASDELVESTLTVSCSADKASVPPPDPKWCPIYEPVKVCLEWLPPFVQDIIREVLDLLPQEAPPIPPVNELVPYEVYDALRIVNDIVKKVMDEVGRFEMVIEPAPIFEDFVETTSVEPVTWEQALDVLPTLPMEAATTDSYVFMHFDGETAIGITCYRGVCDDFTPTLVNDGTGFLLATP